MPKGGRRSAQKIRRLALDFCCAQISRPSGLTRRQGLFGSRLCSAVPGPDTVSPKLRPDCENLMPARSNLSYCGSDSVNRRAQRRPAVVVQRNDGNGQLRLLAGH